jgi:hypothetical protein
LFYSDEVTDAGFRSFLVVMVFLTFIIAMLLVVASIYWNIQLNVLKYCLKVRNQKQEDQKKDNVRTI